MYLAGRLWPLISRRMKDIQSQLSVNSRNSASITQGEFVDLLYRGVLRRSASINEIRHHVEELPNNATFAHAKRLLSSFVGSDESLIVENRLRYRAQFTSLNDDAEQEPVRELFSIGSHCITSAMLKRLDLKRKSGPFDWIFSSLAMVTHCLDTDFEVLLNEKHLRLNPVEQRSDPQFNICDHAYYRDHYGINFVFNHDDMTLPERRAYLGRCVERFRAALRSDDRTLLLGICGNPHSLREHFDQLARALDSYATNTELLIISADGQTAGRFSQPFTALSVSEGRHRLVTLHNSSVVEPFRFNDPLSDILVARMLSTYHIDLRS